MWGGLYKYYLQKLSVSLTLGLGTHKQPYSQADTCEVLGRSVQCSLWLAV